MDARKERIKATRASLDAHVDALAKAVDIERSSAEFRAYLDCQARFHSYSWHNSMLILTQKPDATRVAGFKTWRKFGRFVRKGERGIMIFAPCPWKRETDTGETEAGIFFRAVYVFDVSQTDGDELPTIDVPTLDRAADELLADLSAVCAKRSIKLEFGPIDGGAYGYATRDGAIRVDDSYSTADRAKTLAHELAHNALHFDKNRGTFTRELAELEAESVAYVVCQHFGLDSTVRSARYIALWQGNSKALRESLTRISETARAIIDDCGAKSSSETIAA